MRGAGDILDGDGGVDGEFVAELVGRHDTRVGVGRGDKAVVGA